MLLRKKINVQKAVMFGLDAKVALAIFGALSVITGAALYSALQHARLISFVRNTEELAQAYSSYVLDVGKDLPMYPMGDMDRTLDIRELISSTYPSWKGPYTTRDLDTFTHRFKLYEGYGRYHIYKIEDDLSPCDGSIDCSI